MPSASKLTEYELARLKRMKENADRLQELGIFEAKKELAAVMIKPKTAKLFVSEPGKPRNQESKMRASNRVASMPSRPSYREMEGGVPGSQGRRKSFDTCRNQSHMRALVTSEEARAAEEAAISAAEDLTNPCMVKRMGLNAAFCKEYMPKDECIVILEDLDGMQWETIYKSEKTALSGGWRGYAIDHKLDAGDALVFELVEPQKLKVHIFRALDQPSARVAGLEKPEDVSIADYTYDINKYSVKVRKSLNNGKTSSKRRKENEDGGTGNGKLKPIKTEGKVLSIGIKEVMKLKENDRNLDCAVKDELAISSEDVIIVDAKDFESSILRSERKPIVHVPSEFKSGLRRSQRERKLKAI